MDEEGVLKIFGQIGAFLLVLVLLYLLLRILGLIHSPTLEEVLTTAVFGALFYVGYSYRAIEEIKELRRDLRKLERRVRRLEKK